jgi:hypothetical protein
VEEVRQPHVAVLAHEPRDGIGAAAAALVAGERQLRRRQVLEPSRGMAPYSSLLAFRSSTGMEPGFFRFIRSATSAADRSRSPGNLR